MGWGGCVSEDIELNYIDRHKMTSAQLRGKSLDDQIDKLVRALKRILEKMMDISDDFHITEFTAKAGVELGALILKADGGIEVKWERK